MRPVDRAKHHPIRRLRRGLVVVWLPLFLLLVAPLTSVAQPEVNPTRRAAELADQAANAYADGNVDLAITLFHEAMTYVADPAFAFNLAQLYDSEDEWPQAYRFFARYLELYPGAPNVAQVTDRMEDLESLMVVTHAQIAVSSMPEGAEVTISVAGEPADPYGPTPLEGWVATGRIAVGISLEGYRSAVRHMVARPGVRLEIDFGELDATPIDNNGSAGNGSGNSNGSNGNGSNGNGNNGGGLAGDTVSPAPDARTIAGWSLVGLGVVAGGLTTYFWVDAQNLESDYNSLGQSVLNGDLAVDSLTAEQRALLRDSDAASDQATLGNIFLSVGVASLVGGTLLLLLDGSDEPVSSATEAARLGPFFTPDGGGVTWSGAF